MRGDDDLEDNELEPEITGSTGEDKNNFYYDIVQPKDSNGFVLVLTAFGSKEFKENIIAALKQFDLDDDNSINVDDVHGNSVLKPGYEIIEEPEGNLKN